MLSVVLAYSPICFGVHLPVQDFFLSLNTWQRCNEGTSNHQWPQLLPMSDDRPVLKQLIANSTGEQQRSLRGKAFECALGGVEIKGWKWVAVASKGSPGRWPERIDVEHHWRTTCKSLSVFFTNQLTSATDSAGASLLGEGVGKEPRCSLCSIETSDSSSQLLLHRKYHLHA